MRWWTDFFFFFVATITLHLYHPSLYVRFLMTRLGSTMFGGWGVSVEVSKQRVGKADKKGEDEEDDWGKCCGCSG